MLKTWKQTGFKNHTVSEYYKVQTSLEVHMDTMVRKLSMKTASDDLLLDLSSLWRGHFNLNRKNPKLDQRCSSFPAQPTLNYPWHWKGAVTQKSSKGELFPSWFWVPSYSRLNVRNTDSTDREHSTPTAFSLLSGRDTSTQEPETAGVGCAGSPGVGGRGKNPRKLRFPCVKIQNMSTKFCKLDGIIKVLTV